MGWLGVILCVGLVFIAELAAAEPAGREFVPVAVAAGGSPVSVVVEPGDHMWKLSQEHLDNLLGRPASVEEVARYWVEIVEANRALISSGDPDLIYPGEELILPVVDETPDL